MSAKFRVTRVYSNSISGLVLEGILKKGMALKTNDSIVRITRISVSNWFSFSNIITLLAALLGGAVCGNSTSHPNQVKSGSKTVELTLTGMNGVSIREGDIEFEEIALTNAEEDLMAIDARDRELMINRIVLFLFLFCVALLLYYLMH